MIISLNYNKAVFANHHNGQCPEDQAGNPKDISDVIDAVCESAGVDVEGTCAYVPEYHPHCRIG